MNRFKFAALALAIALLLPGAAQAYPKQGWYVGLGGGVSFEQDTDATIGGVTNKLEFDPGFALSGDIGYGFENQLRPEFEINYRRNTVDKVSGPGAGLRNGHISTVGFMGNLFYDFDTRSGLTPYIGGGAGGALISGDRAGFIVGGASIDNQDFQFAYQGIAGLSYEISERLDATADYRYFATLDPNYKTGSGVGVSDGTYATHNFIIGLRYIFGVPHHLPEPVTMRTAPRNVQVIPAAPVMVQQQPMMQAQMPPPPPVVPETYIVFFDFDKYYLTNEAKETIQRAAEAFRRGGVARVEVTGHTDTMGSQRYNKRLSERRARVVKEYMVGMGIPGNEISTRGAGESELMVPTADRVREAKNRRAEIVLRQ
jgi:outer membrane protein OmpA-like peptidoglycan-associated protein/outer membrane protein W